MSATIRRGLPRVAGGDPWPPAETAVAGVFTSGAPDESASVHVPDVPSPARSESPSLAASESVVTGDSSSSARAEASPVAGAPLRRGLPRAAGGEPWPPEGTAVVTGVVTPLSESETGAAVAAAVPGDAAPAATDPAAAVGAGVSEPKTAATAESSAGEPVAVRRGLPRAAGGDPWPPDGFVAVRTVPALDTAAHAEPGAPGSDVADAAPETRVEPSGAHGAASAVSPGAAASAVPVVRAPRPTLSPVAQSVRDRAGMPGSPDEPQPRGRFRPHWHQAIAGLIGLAGLGALAWVGVFAVRALLSVPFMQDFLVAYPGEYHLPEATDEGFPAWARWSHFLNMFFIVLIIRSGLQVRHQKKPPAYWASKRGSKISINLWLHQSLDILWVVNGIVFVVLLFATGHWARIVPTSWDVFPNALSAALQYISLDWPTENGWVNYNSLQQLAYFSVVFLAAPLAIVSGVRMSGIWPKNAKGLSKVYPIELARAIHFPTMLFFVVFVIFHVGLVFATGALRNLNHMYAGQDVVNWAGFGIFALSIAAVVAAWIAARPLVLAPIASLVGRVSER